MEYIEKRISIPKGIDEYISGKLTNEQILLALYPLVRGKRLSYPDLVELTGIGRVEMEETFVKFGLPYMEEPSEEEREIYRKYRKESVMKAMEASKEKKNMYDEFNKYIIQGEPDKREKALLWKTAIGLQDVDRLKVSDYLVETAEKNINGDISSDEACFLMKSYYEVKGAMVEEEKNYREADIVSSRIANLLSRKAFRLSPPTLYEIHRFLFEGIYDFAGKIREYNITKKEWVLNDDTVLYADFSEIESALAYDMDKERIFDYSRLDEKGVVSHVARFVSNLWQIHAFGEGNTRTTAVFAIQYLRSIGFKDVGNRLFDNNSWYFRNSLVRANYTNAVEKIKPDYSFVENFFDNLLFGANHALENRYLHVDYKKQEKQSTAKPERKGNGRRR